MKMYPSRSTTTHTTKPPRYTKITKENPEKVRTFLSFQMFGEYSKQVGQFARMEGLTEGSGKKDRTLRKELGGYPGKLRLFLGFVWRNTVCRVGEDWVFLTLLAIIMAFTAFIIDRGINIANQG